jgi:hypothetical protein
MEYRLRALTLLVLLLACADCRAVSKLRVRNDGPGSAVLCVDGRFQGTVEPGHTALLEAAGQDAAGAGRRGGWPYHSFLSDAGDLLFAYARDPEGRIDYAEEGLPGGEGEAALSLFGGGVPGEPEPAAFAAPPQPCDLAGLQRASPQAQLVRSPVVHAPDAALAFDSLYGLVRFPSGNTRYSIGIDLDRRDRAACSVRLKAYADQPDDPGRHALKIEQGRASRQGRFLQCSGRIETEVGTLENQSVSIELQLVDDKPASSEGLPLRLDLSIELPGWVSTAPLTLSSESVY